MFRYEQSTGRLWQLVGTGYSGKEEAKNQPDLEDVPSRGPIPRGRWKIAGKYDSPRKGPLVLVLEPVGHTAHGRTAFRMHGDAIGAPGTASEGCVIMPRPVRALVWRAAEAGDRELEVVR